MSEEEREEQPVVSKAPAPESGGPWARVWANPAYRFVIVFLPYLGIASLLYPFLAKRYHASLQAMIHGTANILHSIFDLFTERVSGSQKLLMFDGFLVTIVDECTGIYEMIIFSAAVLAFPASPGKKVVGLLAGNLIIYGFNILRISLLILIGRYFPDVFDFMHLYFWQATMILMIASVWLLWLVKVVRRETPSDSPGS